MTALRRKSVLVSPSLNAAEMRPLVPSGNGAVILYGQSIGSPMLRTLSDTSMVTDTLIGELGRPIVHAAAPRPHAPGRKSAGAPPNEPPAIAEIEPVKRASAGYDVSNLTVQKSALTRVRPSGIPNARAPGTAETAGSAGAASVPDWPASSYGRGRPAARA